MTPQANKNAQTLFGLSECFRGMGYASILAGIGAAIYTVTNVEPEPTLFAWAILWATAGVIGSLPAFTVAYLIRLALQIEEHLRPARAPEPQAVAVAEQV